ncbi:hypothetical protein IAU59_003586 [Kwoniella sp. CBS 9459]
MRYQAPNNPLFAYALPRLPSFPIPPLPHIHDKALYTTVISHTSLQGLNRRGIMSLTPPEEGWEIARDYERLEHVGDGLLESIASGLIQDLYPWLRQGGAAIIRDYLVSNATLAQISTFYHLPSLLRADPSSIEDVRRSEKVQASIFEAWIAGVFYDYLLGNGYSDAVAEECGPDDDEVKETDQEEGDEEDNEVPTVSVDVRGDATPDRREGLVNIAGNSHGAKQEYVCASAASDVRRHSDAESADCSPTLDDLALVRSASTTPLLPKSGREVEVDGDPSPNPLLSSVPPLSADTKQRPMLASNGAPYRFTAREDEYHHTNADSFAERGELVTGYPVVEWGTSNTLRVLATPAYARTKGQAYDYLLSWLIPLLTPYCRWIHALLSVEQARLDASLPPIIPRLATPARWAQEDREAHSQGSLRSLAQHPLVGVGEKVGYVRMPEIGQRWKVIARVVDKEGKVWTGDAVRGSWKAARLVAAWKILIQLNAYQQKTYGESGAGRGDYHQQHQES